MSEKDGARRSGTASMGDDMQSAGGRHDPFALHAARIRALEATLRDVRRMAREADTSPQTADRWVERIEERIEEVLGGDDD